MRIYLAGKIAKNDWRTEIVGHRLRGAIGIDWDWKEWPVLKRTIFGIHDYVGPFFISCDHGCAHGPDSHGLEPKGCINECGGHMAHDPRRRLTIELCRRAIASADLVFCWLNSTTAYGTFVEIGFASALGVPIIIASPRSFKELDDMWFAVQSALSVLIEHDGVTNALIRAIRVTEAMLTRHRDPIAPRQLRILQ